MHGSIDYHDSEQATKLKASLFGMHGMSIDRISGGMIDYFAYSHLDDSY